MFVIESSTGDVSSFNVEDEGVTCRRVSFEGVARFWGTDTIGSLTDGVLLLSRRDFFVFNVGTDFVTSLVFEFGGGFFFSVDSEV